MESRPTLTEALSVCSLPSVHSVIPRPPRLPPFRDPRSPPNPLTAGLLQRPHSPQRIQRFRALHHPNLLLRQAIQLIHDAVNEAVGGFDVFPVGVYIQVHVRQLRWLCLRMRCISAQSCS